MAAIGMYLLRLRCASFNKDAAFLAAGVLGNCLIIVFALSVASAVG